MGLLNKLTIKNLKLNKKRTIVTIIGIMLSVALITAVATMYTSAIKSMVEFETNQKGEFHVAFYDVDVKDLSSIKNNKGVDKIYVTSNIGYAKMDRSKNQDKPYVYLKGFTKDSLEGLSVKIIEGRLPENENEILIPNHLKTNGRVELKVGDTISLDVGRRISDTNELFQGDPYKVDNGERIIDTTTKTYKIVGSIERPTSSIEPYSAPGYTFITYLADDKVADTVDVFAKFNQFGSSNYLKVTADILGIDDNVLAKMNDVTNMTEEETNRLVLELSKAKYVVDINEYLILLENNPLKERNMRGVAGAVAIVLIIIVFASVFCIKNSFDISITEKIKQYGMLKSVGATQKQIRKNVLYEGTILGLIGIPLGLLLGFAASYILIILSNIFLKGIVADDLKLVFSFSGLSVLVSCVLGIVTIYLSSLRSASKAAKVSPILSIRNSAEIKIGSRKLKTPFYIKKLFGIGGAISHKNFKRNKKKYRTTILSIIASVSIFIGISYFIDGVFKEVDHAIAKYDYNVAASINLNHVDPELTDRMLSTTSLEYIDDYAVERYGEFNIINPIYTDKYIEINRNKVKNNQEYVEENEKIYVMTLGDYQYRKYLEKLNLDYDEFQDKAILYSGNEGVINLDENNKEKVMYAEKYSYKSGDIINIYGNDVNNPNNITIGNVNKIKPFGNRARETILIVSDKMFDKIAPDGNKNITIYYQSSNANKLQDQIEGVMGENNYDLENVEEKAKMVNNIYILIAIFVYGFIIVISMIGITNIFNTITTNMSLRKREFAMLKSVGMTTKEFRKMIRMESIFIGVRTLIFGVPIGVVISYLIYSVMVADKVYGFDLPIAAILISIVVVYLLITILMNYSMNKINKENIIETIKNENI